MLVGNLARAHVPILDNLVSKRLVEVDVPGSPPSAKARFAHSTLAVLPFLERRAQGTGSISIISPSHLQVGGVGNRY